MSYETAPGISIHAAREGGDEVISDKIAEANISIHAAREGGDHGRCPLFYTNKEFQSTPPVKAATYIPYRFFGHMGFQSTPPVKAATIRRESAGCVMQISIHAAREGGDAAIRTTNIKGKISIHAAREGGDPYGFLCWDFCWISIHAAREGGDVTVKVETPETPEFQSTPPVKAATRAPNEQLQHIFDFNPRRP